MAKKKALHVVSGLDPKDRNRLTTAFEKDMREIYRRKDPEISLSFTHSGEDPYTAADLIKKKDPLAVIFDLSVPADRVTSLSTAIKKRFSGGEAKEAPRIVRISGHAPESDCIVRTHDNARALLLETVQTAVA